MSKKMYAMISAIVGAAGTLAIAAVTYCGPPYAEAINASVSIAVTAACEILLQFVKPEK